MSEDRTTKVPLVSPTVAGAVASASPLGYLLLTGSVQKIFGFLNRQGQAEKADEEFFVNIISSCRDHGVDEVELELTKDQITGLDITIKKAAKTVGAACDLGIKGEGRYRLKVKFKD